MIRISDMYGVPMRLLSSCSAYGGVGQAAPPTKPPPVVGDGTVALPVGEPVGLLPWTKLTTAAVLVDAPA
jgi:hypothetical protein